jgi:hypothetical protein
MESAGFSPIFIKEPRSVRTTTGCSWRAHRSVDTRHWRIGSRGAMRIHAASAMFLGLALIIAAVLIGGVYSVNTFGQAFAVVVTNRLTGDSFYCYPERGCFEMNVSPASPSAHSRLDDATAPGRSAIGPDAKNAPTAAGKAP